MHPLVSAPVLGTIKSLLRPLVRLCVRHAIKAVEVEELLKSLFVEEARAVLKESAQEESVSRLSIMTGLQRPLVSSLINTAPQENTEDTRASLLMKVAGAWQTMSAFTTAQGQPRVLTAEGKQSEFAQLVKEVSQSLNPYTVLFEMERAGIVERTKRGLKLTQGTLVTQQDKQQGLSFLSLDLNDLIESVHENIFDAHPLKNHHVTTEFDNLSDEAAQKMRQILLQEGHRVHLRLRKLMSKFDRDIQKNCDGSGRNRVVFTSFSRVHNFVSGK